MRCRGSFPRRIPPFSKASAPRPNRTSQLLYQDPMDTPMGKPRRTRPRSRKPLERGLQVERSRSPLPSSSSSSPLSLLSLSLGDVYLFLFREGLRQYRIRMRLGWEAKILLFDLKFVSGISPTPRRLTQITGQLGGAHCGYQVELRR